MFEMRVISYSFETVNNNLNEFLYVFFVFVMLHAVISNARAL